MKVWTYERIDMELLRDDIDSVTEISPRVAWKTKEQAMSAANSDEKELWADYDTDEDYEPLRWVEEDEEFYTANPEDGITIRVYTIRIED